MDKKEKQLINYYYSLIKENKFNERDIYTFLILTRYYINDLSKCKWLKEFANLVAHRKRDRDIIYENLKLINKDYEEYSKIDFSDYYNTIPIEKIKSRINYLYKLPKTEEIKNSIRIEFNNLWSELSKIKVPEFIVPDNFNSFTIQDIEEELNCLFIKLGFNKLEHQDTYSNLVLCIFSILQDSEYKNNDTIKMIFGKSKFGKNTIGLATKNSDKSPMVCISAIENKYTTTDIETPMSLENIYQVLRDENNILSIYNEAHKL